MPDLTGKYVEVHGERPKENAVLSEDGKVYIYNKKGANLHYIEWNYLCDVDEECPEPIQFEIPGSDIMVTGPLRTILFVIFSVVKLESKTELIEVIFNAFSEGGWKPPLAEDHSAGQLTFPSNEPSGVGCLHWNVQDCADVAMAFASGANRITFTNEKGDLVSLQASNFPNLILHRWTDIEPSGVKKDAKA